MMDWQCQLITLYPIVCEHDREELGILVQRFAPYADLRFTDEPSHCAAFCIAMRDQSTR